MGKAQTNAEIRAAKNKEHITLEELQEVVKKIGAPPIGNTKSSRILVEVIPKFKNPQRFERRRNNIARHNNERKIIKEFEDLLITTLARKKDLCDFCGDLCGDFEATIEWHGVSKIQNLADAFEAAKQYITPKFFGDEADHLDGPLSKDEAVWLFSTFRRAWREEKQKIPSASKTYRAIGAALLKAGIKISDEAIKKSVKEGELRLKKRQQKDKNR